MLSRPDIQEKMAKATVRAILKYIKAHDGIDYLTRYDALSIPKIDTGAFEKEISGINTQLAELETQLKSRQQTFNDLTAPDKELTPETINNLNILSVEIKTLSQKITILEGQRLVLSQKIDIASQQVTQARKEIDKDKRRV